MEGAALALQRPPAQVTKRRRKPTISSTAALNHRRSARSESQPQRVGKRSRGIEALLDSLEIRGDEQLRRRRSERARRQKNRRANCAIIVIGRNLRRRMRFGVNESDALRGCRVRVLRYGVQMDMSESDRDLERQRNQRQHRAIPSMATNPAHPTSPPTRPRASPHANVTLLHQARGSLRPVLNQHVSTRVNSRALLRIIAI